VHAASNKPGVSVIVPTLNEAEHIKKCLLSLLDAGGENEDYEIIVVDNGSTDDTVKLAREAGVRTMSKLNGSIGSLRNYGAKNAKGGILAFVDGDCVVSEDWLKNAMPYFRDDKIAVVGSRLTHAGRTWVARAWSLLHSRKRTKGEIDWVPSGNMIVSKRLFDEVDGFDEELETGEDYDLCLRLGEKGYRIYSDPGIGATHLDPPESIRAFFRKELWHGKEMVRMLSRRNTPIAGYPSLIYAAVYLALMVGMGVGAIVYLAGGSSRTLVILGVSAMIIPWVLALRTLYGQRKFTELPSLAILYALYGAARAVCLLDLRNYQRRKDGSE